jgi:hypothetical protein
MSLLYSNYIKVSDNEGWFDNGSSYYLTTKNGCYSRQAAVIYTMNNDCEELKKPIVHLLSLQTNTPACIIGYRANFYYSINSECKIYEYHYDNKDIAPIHGHYDLDFHVITSYDDSTKSVNTNLIGNYGFYIPTRSAGYFEIEVKIEQNDYVRTYCFHKNFSFSSETHYDRNINITPIMIDTITSDYKRMTF